MNRPGFFINNQPSFNPQMAGLNQNPQPYKSLPQQQSGPNLPGVGSPIFVKQSQLFKRYNSPTQRRPQQQVPQAMAKNFPTAPQVQYLPQVVNQPQLMNQPQQPITAPQILQNQLPKNVPASNIQPSQQYIPKVIPPQQITSRPISNAQGSPIKALNQSPPQSNIPTEVQITTSVQKTPYEKIQALNMPTAVRQSTILPDGQNIVQQTAVQYKTIKYEQPLQVVDLKQYEEKWLAKYKDQLAGLQKQNVSFELQNQQSYQSPLFQDNFQKDEQIRQLMETIHYLEQEKSNLQMQINSARFSGQESPQISELLRQLAEVQSIKKNQHHQIELLSLENDKLKTQLNKYESDHLTGTQAMHEVLEKNKELNQKLIKEQKAHDETKQELYEVSQHLQSNQDRMNSLNLQNQQNQQKIDDMKGQLKDLKDRNISLEIQNKQQNQEKGLINILYTIKENLEAQLNVKSQQLDDLIAQNTELKSKAQSFESQANSWKEKFIESNKKHHQAEEELALTKTDLEKAQRVLDDQKMAVMSARPRLSIRQSTQQNQPTQNNMSAPRDSNYNRQTTSPQSEVLTAADLQKIQSFIPK